MANGESAAAFSTLLETMSQLDFFTLVLPFVLSYTIFFLALKRISIFEDEDEKFPALISVAASFFVAQFIATNPWYQAFFIDYFGRLTIGIIGILGLLVLLGFVGWDASDAKGPGLGLIIISIVGAAFLTAGGFGEPYDIETPLGEFGIDELSTLLLDTGLIWILIIGGVIYWISSEDTDSDRNALSWLLGNTAPPDE